MGLSLEEEEHEERRKWWWWRRRNQRAKPFLRVIGVCSLVDRHYVAYEYILSCIRTLVMQTIHIYYIITLAVLVVYQIYTSAV